MATTTPLFTVPIPPFGAHPGGTIVATEPAPAVYLLTITSPADNRLTTVSCNAMLDALDLIEFGGYPPGVVVTTSGIDKFYSNGLDLEHAVATEAFIPGALYKLFNRFLTYAVTPPSTPRYTTNTQDQKIPHAHHRPPQRPCLRRRQYVKFQLFISPFSHLGSCQEHLAPELLPTHPD